MRIWNYIGHSGQGEWVEVKNIQEALNLKPYGMFSVPLNENQVEKIGFDNFVFLMDDGELVCQPSLNNTHYSDDDVRGKNAYAIFETLMAIS